MGLKEVQTSAVTPPAWGLTTDGSERILKLFDPILAPAVSAVRAGQQTGGSTMSNLMRWSGVDIADPIRRLLEGETGSWLRVEEYREGDSMVVKAEVPGIDPNKDVDITLTGDELRINVRHEEKSEHKDKRGYRSEFRYGTFSRSVALPGAVYNDGILEVRIPVSEQKESPARKIPITRSGETPDANRGTSTGETEASGSRTDAGAPI